MKNEIHTTKINIKHITFIVNLKNTEGEHYLVFKEKVDELLITYPFGILEFDLFENQYAVLYILPSPNEKLVSSDIVNCMNKIKMDCIVIDELFPENNEYYFNETLFPITAEWVKCKQFDEKQSFIEVK
ncbi:hypothetical protein H0I29_11815 [Polaribacter sp. R2A056_3_33]|uniref:hypothetical protein n=1 Tax=Polaribacter sp. R2A056_3_33 TaxID=2745563 RepID=UPI001C4FCE3C|nr:hypothetical protein [Polaribacter sp. R2A056_3_33]QXP69313.1 hypothetical protein H0I29_11815 [Polaribacter sp. R2A056_3_33]